MQWPGVRGFTVWRIGSFVFCAHAPEGQRATESLRVFALPRLHHLCGEVVPPGSPRGARRSSTLALSTCGLRPQRAGTGCNSAATTRNIEPRRRMHLHVHPRGVGQVASKSMCLVYGKVI